MSTFGELLKETPPAAPVPKRSFRAHVEPVAEPRFFAPSGLRNEQIHSLVQQLFFRHPSGPVRRVGFAPMEASSQIARLCLDVARALVNEGKYEVGLIDARADAAPLQSLLEIPDLAVEQARRAIAPRLWLIDRESWYHGDSQPPAEQDLERLRELTTEFDFAIVHCPHVSWLTARIAHCCDGLVLVLTANKTRSLVAAQVKEQLKKAQVNLLGVVLAERNFPVPDRLYRSL